MIREFEGTTASDKNYRYLVEMLTKCILKLDTIEWNNSKDRLNMKGAIQDVDQAIIMLETKRLETNLSDIRRL